MNKNTCFVILTKSPKQTHRAYQNSNLNKFYYKLVKTQVQNISKFYPKSKIIITGDNQLDYEFYEITQNNKKITHHRKQYNEYSNYGEYIQNIVDIIPNHTAICMFDVSFIFDPKVMEKKIFKKTSVLSSTSKKFESQIGCTLDQNNNIEFVFYDLDNKICELIYIKPQDINKFKNIMSHHVNNNMYLFEIMNTLINHSIDLNINFVKENVLHCKTEEHIDKTKRLLRKITNY